MCDVGEFLLLEDALDQLDKYELSRGRLLSDTRIRTIHRQLQFERGWSNVLISCLPTESVFYDIVVAPNVDLKDYVLPDNTFLYTAVCEQLVNHMVARSRDQNYIKGFDYNARSANLHIRGRFYSFLPGKEQEDGRKCQLAG
jgi:hypothetical protein